MRWIASTLRTCLGGSAPHSSSSVASDVTPNDGACRACGHAVDVLAWPEARGAVAPLCLACVARSYGAKSSKALLAEGTPGSSGLALDVLGGPLFYRLLITGGPIDERLASGVVDLIMRGFGPTRSRPSRSRVERERP